MTACPFRAAGEPPPAKPPKPPRLLSANSPPTRRPNKDLLRAIAAAESREAEGS